MFDHVNKTIGKYDMKENNRKKIWENIPFTWNCMDSYHKIDFREIILYEKKKH